MSRRHIIGFGLLLTAATAVPAYAQPAQLPTPQTMQTDFPACTKKATDADQELAKQKFIAARQDSEEGNYDTAIKRFKVAYDLDCSKPELLLIISSVFEKKGDKQAALAALEVYTQRAPKDSPDMPTTLTKIENLKKQLAAAPPPTASSSAPPKEEVQEHSVAPWIVVGIGGAALITGIVLHLTASYPAGCMPDAEPEPKCTRQPKDPPSTDPDPNVDSVVVARGKEAGQIHGRKVAGTISILAGSGLIVGGLIWHFIEPTGPKTTTGIRRLTPTIAPGFGGLSYGGTF
jgi:hypothetical protein